jgi:hypothetical protein
MRFISSRAALALVAAVAVSVATATAASAALPEFSKAIRGTTGDPVTFTLKGGIAQLNVPNVENFSCGSSTGTGSITGAKSGTAKLTFHECGSALRRCQSPGAESGTIVTETLPFALVYTEKEPAKKVAIDFNRKGEKLVTFSCGLNKWTVRHAILAPVTPINTLTKTFTTAFTVSNGLQTPTENYNEELTGVEKSFPEISFNEGAYKAGFGLSSSIVLENMKQEGELLPEGKIEA